MKPRRSLSAAIGLSLFMLAVGCSTNQEMEKTTARYPSVTNSTFLEHDQYAIVEFEEGDDELSTTGKEKLKDFIENATYGGKEIENIKILAWSDQDIKNGTGTDFDKNIASVRGEAIEYYLREDLKTGGDYVNYNMAATNNTVENIFKSEDWKRSPLSKAESRTLPKTKGNDEYTKLMDNKASKALVVVEYE